MQMQQPEREKKLVSFFPLSSALLLLLLLLQPSEYVNTAQTWSAATGSDFPYIRSLSLVVGKMFVKNLLTRFVCSLLSLLACLLGISQSVQSSLAECCMFEFVVG